jgi:O-antigen ligase
MEWLLGGYVWLYIHRPFEVWPVLGVIQLERLYMLGMLAVWICNLRGSWVHNRLHGAFAFFAFALLSCWFVSPHADVGYKTVEDFFKVAVFYVLLISTIRDEQSLRKMVAIYLVAVALYMTHSLLEYKLGRGVWRMGIWRMVGVDETYRDPNTFSATLLYSLPLTLPFWMERPRGWVKLGLVYYALLTVTCVLLTGSRGGFVGLAFLAAVLVWNSPRRGQLTALVLIGSPIAWSMLPEELHNRFYTLIDPSVGPRNAKQSADSRTAFFYDGLRLWADSPLTGCGPGAFGRAAGHGMQAHNLYGQAVGEMGLLGALGLAGIVLAFWLNHREMKRWYREAGWPPDFCLDLSRSVMIAIALLLVLGFGSHNLYRYTWMWFGAFQAAALHHVRQVVRHLIAWHADDELLDDDLALEPEFADADAPAAHS